jgi:hypothetical protein
MVRVVTADDAGIECPLCGETFDCHEALSPNCPGEDDGEDDDGLCVHCSDEEPCGLHFRAWEPDTIPKRAPASAKPCPFCCDHGRCHTHVNVDKCQACRGTTILVFDPMEGL